MKKSKGFWAKSSRKSTKSVRQKGILPITRIIKSFKPGDKVHIKIEPSYPKGMPHPRFHGRTGLIKGKKGRAYEIKLRDGNKEKSVIAHPVHLNLQR